MQTNYNTHKKKEHKQGQNKLRGIVHITIRSDTSAFLIYMAQKKKNKMLSTM